MKKTKLLFMGTPEFAATVLRGIIAHDEYEILAVVTQPDRKVGRKHELKMPPVKTVALEFGLPVFQPEKLSQSKELEALLELGADGIVTSAFGQFLPSRLLDAVQFAVNTHGSLLPKYRGGAPIQYALRNGDEVAGVTLIEMVKKMDAGGMIAKTSIPILDEDNAGSLFEKLAIVARDLLLESLPQYLLGNLKPVAQDETKVTFSPNISPEEEKIDWTKSAREIFNHIRSLAPHPVAHTFLNGARFKIEAVEIVEKNTVSTDNIPKPGEIVEKTKKRLLVATKNGFVSLKVVQPQGKPQMSIESYLNGLGQKVKVGDCFDPK
ncbi:methionyl-tRNA formyltransferase [Lactococcus hircilactis]|uniref:Methionyl-tRNA formyltransferase n=1 Tax=Lactococcus hircilactis TaxID=1494462 RepID=A0A7X1ZBI1_9LACT|nr:methionyl-tRNA formyltransferase [Lactococcus hircilactis]MQW40065.1 methionyl-tRNA formyltransferase [Lactococcus hircilactis]